MEPWLEETFPLKYRFAIRTSAQLATTARNFRAELVLRCDGESADARDMLRLLLLGATKGRVHPKLPHYEPFLLAGTLVTLAARGPDAPEALRAALRAFDERNEPV